MDEGEERVYRERLLRLGVPEQAVQQLIVDRREERRARIEAENQVTTAGHALIAAETRAAAD